MRVSIHAPAGGATSGVTALICFMKFRSTRPQGARRDRRPWRHLPRHVSIHAPAGGATRWRPRRASSFRSFDPRARRGRDPLYGYRGPYYGEFRSTRPQGARPHARADIEFHTEFRSTRPQGARRIVIDIQDGGVTFRSTRPQGARLSGARGPRSRSDVSIHAPAGGATAGAAGARAARGSFDPRARRGRDPDGRDVRPASRVSIHAPAGGATTETICWD